METELAKVKAAQGDTSSPPDQLGTSNTAGMTPIQQALHGRSPSTSTFDPSSLFVVPGTVNPWLEENQPASLTDTNYKKWINDFKLPQPKVDTLEKNFQKALQLWPTQPDAASKTIHRVSVAMGLEPHRLKNSTMDELAGHQDHDGGVDSELVTSFIFEIQWLNHQTIFEGSHGCALVYSELS